MLGGVDEGRAEAAQPMASVLQKSLNSWGNLVERLPVGVYVCDNAGVIVEYNERAVELWGKPPRLPDDPIHYCGAWRLCRPDGEQLQPDELPVEEVLRTQRPVRDREFLIKREDGSCRAVLINVDPLFDEAGGLIGAVNCFQDISALRRADQQLRDSERRYCDLLNALPAAVYTTDAAGRIDFFNTQAVEFWGRAPDLGSDEWCGSWKLYHPDGRPMAHAECPMAQSLAQGRPIRGAEAIAERPDGVRVPFIPYPTPLRDSDGVVIGAVNMLIDITKRKQAELRQDALLDELNHRVKNTLATVQSLASQTLRRHSGEQAFAMLEGRLLALSRAHDQLKRTQWRSADFRSLLQEALAPYHERVALAGEAVDVPPRIALTLAMVLHELTANAVAYGALSAVAGTLEVSWSCESDDKQQQLHVNWCESGGPAVSAPERIGFGGRLLKRGIEAGLRGSAGIRFEPTGVRCSMRVPLRAE